MRYVTILLVGVVIIYVIITSLKVLFIVLTVLTMLSGLIYLSGYISGNKETKQLKKQYKMKRKLLKKLDHRTLALMGEKLSVTRPFSKPKEDLELLLTLNSYNKLVATLNLVQNVKTKN